MCILPFVLFLAIQSPVAMQEPRDPAKPATRIEFKITPLADLYLLVRAHASTSPPTARPPDLPGIDDAIAAAKRLEKELQLSLAWGVLDRELEFCTDAAQLTARFEQLPERRGGGADAFELRALAVALSKAIEVLEPRFLDELWHEREAQLLATKSQLDARFVPHERDCFADLFAHYVIPDPGITIPLFLTLDAPPFGAVTFARADGGGICFVAVRGAPGTQLDETVLHECTHAIDVATPESVGLVEELRAKLAAAGIGPRDRRNRDVWHTIFFAEAASTIRRRVDDAHRPLGEVSGYYAKVPTIAPIVLPRWTRYVNGELDRATLLVELVAETKKDAPPAR